MTNNPTIDGVSRELLELAMLELTDSWSWAPELRALLDASVAEREEPVAYANPKSFENFDNLAHLGGVYAHEWMFANPAPEFVALYLAPPELAALQSTITRLEGRIAELESGRGEIIHQVRTHGSDCWEDISGESLELCQCDPEEYEIRKVFTAPPAPTVVVLPDRKPLVTTTEESDIHVRMLEQIERNGWNACLDATAALNGPAK